MARYQVILAYDGSEFRGFQRQANARTVQREVEAALRGLGWQGRAVLFAGRTDCGVHASGQVIAFDLDWAHSPEALQRALNAGLPADVAVRALFPAADDFHPRYAAEARRYRYRLFCEQAPNPLRERYAWRVWPPVAPEPMRQFARQLLGTHDFAAFGTPPRKGGKTIRTVSRAAWLEEGGDLAFDVVANAFLYRMIRRLVFLQVKIGQGRLDWREATAYLENPRRTPLQGLAPAAGLTLVEVIYPPELAGGWNGRKNPEKA